MAAVSDSSPLILYAAISQLELLQALYGEVLIPPAVWQETVERGGELPGTIEVSAAHWIRRTSPSERDVLPLRRAGLGQGEAEAIALAMSAPSRTTLILDDRPARKFAVTTGLDIVGSGGVLVLAKRKGLIGSVKPLLSELLAAGLYLSDAVFDTFLELASET